MITFAGTVTDVQRHACPLTYLSTQVEQHKAGGQEVAAAPGGLDVVPLLVPLEPHADPILQEGTDQTQARQVGQILLRHTQELGRGEGGGAFQW